MREMRGLMISTNLVELAYRGRDVRFSLVALLDNDLALAYRFGFLFFQGCHARLAFEQGIRLHGAASAENNSLRGNEFAIERGHCQRWLIAFRRESVA